jgi:hypothetical protein
MRNPRTEGGGRFFLRYNPFNIEPTTSQPSEFHLQNLSLSVESKYAIFSWRFSNKMCQFQVTRRVAWEFFYVQVKSPPPRSTWWVKFHQQVHGKCFRTFKVFSKPSRFIYIKKYVGSCESTVIFLETLKLLSQLQNYLENFFARYEIFF